MRPYGTSQLPNRLKINLHQPYYTLYIIHFPLKSVATAGTFDGVHTGHLRILREVVRLAHERGVPSVVITYWPHPRLVLYPEQTDLKLLSSLPEREGLLKAIGIDEVVVLPFTKEFATLTYAEYAERILRDQLQVGLFVIGHDHQFGRGRQGSFDKIIELAPQLGFEVKEIPAWLVEENAVSSTRIRHALEAGDLELAHRYLGRRYQFSGTVVHGRKLGRTLGYPTLNLELEEPHKLLPQMGVYAVRVCVQGRWHGGAMNIGLNPTVAGKGFTVEIYVLDFNQDIYGQQVTVECLERLRPEAKFDSLEALVVQMSLDVEQARTVNKTV